MGSEREGLTRIERDEQSPFVGTTHQLWNFIT